MKPKNQALDVWGDFACFTQPAFKVERFSYPVITPSAARGVFDAIYCKPKEFRWRIVRVEILTQPNFIALKRNEVKEKVPVNQVYRWMRGEEPPSPILADADKSLTGSDVKGRTQRQTMALKNVRYRLHAKVHPGRDSRTGSRAWKASSAAGPRTANAFTSLIWDAGNFRPFLNSSRPMIRVRLRSTWIWTWAGCCTTFSTCPGPAPMRTPPPSASSRPGSGRG